MWEKKDRSITESYERWQRTDKFNENDVCELSVDFSNRDKKIILRRTEKDPGRFLERSNNFVLTYDDLKFIWDKINEA